MSKFYAFFALNSKIVKKSSIMKHSFPNEANLAFTLESTLNKSISKLKRIRCVKQCTTTDLMNLKKVILWYQFMNRCCGYQLHCVPPGRFGKCDDLIHAELNIRFCKNISNQNRLFLSFECNNYTVIFLHFNLSSIVTHSHGVHFIAHEQQIKFVSENTFFVVFIKE